MAGIIWIIIIAVVVIGEVKKQQRRQQGNRGAGQQRYQPPQQSYRPGNQSIGQAQQASLAAMNAKQQELKNRLTQRYGKPVGTTARQTGNVQQRAGQQNMQRTVQKPNDILSRANANVRENAQDLLEQQMAVKHEGGPMVRDAHDLVGAVDITESSELMRQVSDLMIMGYQADLTFERDFLAEGVELLNRYELPTGI